MDISSPEDLILLQLILNMDKHHNHQFVFDRRTWRQLACVEPLEILDGLLQKVVLILQVVKNTLFNVVRALVAATHVTGPVILSHVVLRSVDVCEILLLLKLLVVKSQEHIRHDDV